MEDYLKKVCKEMDINLIYNNNKRKVLSAEIKEDQPLIRANKIFRFCPYFVSQAIIGYYVDPKNTNRYENIIKDYLNKDPAIENYKIYPSSSNFKEKVEEKLLYYEDKDNNQIVEFDIVSMKVKDIWGNEKVVDTNLGTINSDGEEYKSINIIVDNSKLLNGRE